MFFNGLGAGILAVVAVAGATQQSCPIGGSPWVVQYGRNTQGLFNEVVTGDTTFNVTFGIRHGPSNGMGQVLPNGTIKMHVFAGNRTVEYCFGEWSADCHAINWTNPCLADSWCRAWTPGCNSPQPPYGEGFSFLSTFGSNMVLQQGPAKAAVYGIVVGQPTAVKVTVTNNENGYSYDVDATFNATQQAVGPAFEGGQYPGPYQTWKALLNPTAAGGNYTISAVCTGCTLDGSFSNINITNVTFGDVWHCSGQSNMWLPVGNAFAHNDTIKNISNGMYNNIRIMAGNSASGTTNPWMTAAEAAITPPQSGRTIPVAPLLNFGAACWYFGQGLTDKLTAVGKSVPIGLTDTAIGGQRIEEYMVNDTTLYACSDHPGLVPGQEDWNGRLFGSQTIPFVDMTIKGWLWYQGENNMGGTKGSAIAKVGYSCEQKALVEGWRKVWSMTPETTDPMAPFGIVTLASSGSEGGPDIGAMRLAQTAGYGVLPSPMLPNTFVAQAYDLDDKWGPGAGSCQKQSEWACCNYDWGLAGRCTYNKTACGGREKLCAPACASTTTRSVMGGIHPRWKRPVGERLATAAFNTVYNGTKAYTGPTLSGCTLASDTLTIEFNSTLLRGDSVTVGKLPTPSGGWPNPSYDGVTLSGGEMSSSGSQLYVQTNASLFCVEKQTALNSSGGSMGFDYCPTWAGGDGSKVPGMPYDSQWIMLNYTLAPGSINSIVVDLTPLNGSVPTAVQYAWGVVDCCDYSDPNLYITHGCGLCPIGSSSGLPANPFKAQIKGGVCKCVAPQVC